MEDRTFLHTPRPFTIVRLKPRQNLHRRCKLGEEFALINQAVAFSIVLCYSSGKIANCPNVKLRPTAPQKVKYLPIALKSNVERQS